MKKAYSFSNDDALYQITRRHAPEDRSLVVLGEIIFTKQKHWLHILSILFQLK
jgi:hypothetical protein